MVCDEAEGRWSACEGQVLSEEASEGGMAIRARLDEYAASRLAEYAVAEADR